MILFGPCPDCDCAQSPCSEYPDTLLVNMPAWNEWDLSGCTGMGDPLEWTCRDAIPSNFPLFDGLLYFYSSDAGVCTWYEVVDEAGVNGFKNFRVAAGGNPPFLGDLLLGHAWLVKVPGTTTQQLSLSYRCLFDGFTWVYIDFWTGILTGSNSPAGTYIRCTPATCGGDGGGCASVGPASIVVSVPPP